MKQLLSGVLLALLLAAGSAWAGVLVEKVTAGMDGYVRGERWIPVVFQLRGTSGSFQGAIEVVRGETVFRKSVDLSAGSARRVEILVYQTGNFEPLGYRILDASGRVVTKDRMDTRILNYQDNVVLVVSGSDYSHQFLNGIQNPWGGKTFVAYLKPEALYSDTLAYSSADAVALGGLSLPELSPAVRKALLMYAATGGTFICSSATDLSVLQDPSLGGVFPAISAELNEVSRGEFLLSRWSVRNAGTEFPEMAIPMQRVRPNPSDNVLVASTPGLSIVSSSPYYKGNVVYFAFDYTRMPEALSSIFPGYWNDLVFPTRTVPPPFGAPLRLRLEDNPRAQAFLYDIPGLTLPDVKWFALFFFVYLMAIGPLQYLILTRLKKNAMLWTTFPLIIAVFTGAALGYTKMRHSENHIRQVQVLDVFPPLGMQSRYQGFGTATSDSGTFTYQAVPENSYMTKAARQSFTGQMEPFLLSEDLPHSIIGENVKTWTYRTLDAASIETLDAPIDVSVTLDGSRLHGKVTNSGSVPLENSFFAYDYRNAATVGRVEPGATAEFSVELDNSTRIPFAEPQLTSLLAFRGISLNNPHFFLAETYSQGEIVINGKKHATTCMQYTAVYVNLKQGGNLSSWRADYTQPPPVVYR